MSHYKTALSVTFIFKSVLSAILFSKYVMAKTETKLLLLIIQAFNDTLNMFYNPFFIVNCI